GTKKGCDLTLLALEYDPVPQGQTNGDKRKSDAVFACFMDDRIDLGLSLAEEIESRDARTLLCAAALAVDKFSSLNDVSWLVNDLKSTDAAGLEPVIDSFGQIDLVVQSTLREVFVDHMVPHCRIAA
ncbi:MAG: hypothetical protein HOM03_11010, partial [Marinovum sp.]|nr:hypothetical protein [Marinovum sp.]